MKLTRILFLALAFIVPSVSAYAAEKPAAAEGSAPAEGGKKAKKSKKAKKGEEAAAPAAEGEKKAEEPAKK